MKGSLRRIVAVLAATATLGGTAFIGVSSAYADDQPTETQTQTTDAEGTQADATDADQATAADQAKKEQAEQQAQEEAQQQAEAEQQAEQKSEGDQPKSEAAPNAETANNITVEWTAPDQMIGGNNTSYGYGDNAKYVDIPVKISGLEPGAQYRISLRVSYSDNWKPTVGETTGESGEPRERYNETLITASSDTYEGNLKFTPSSYSSYYAVVEKADYDSTNNYTTYTYVYAGETKQVKVLDPDQLIKVGKINVEDPGTHTVGLSTTYDVDPSLWDQVDSVCLSSTVLRVYSATATGDNDYPWGSSGLSRLWDCTTGAVSDNDTTNPELEKIYAVSNLVQGQTGDEAIGQWFKRGTTYGTADDTDPDYKLTSNTGTLNSTIVGLLPGIHYGNWGSDDQRYPEYGKLYDFMATKPNGAKDPLAVTYAGLVVTFKNGAVWSQSPDDDQLLDFTTASTSSAVLSSDELNDGNRNGVEGDLKHPKPKSIYRVYINNLVESCKTKSDGGSLPDGSYCYWTGYIYSDPVQLASPDGASAAIRRDDQGRYYADFVIPAGYSGEHKIALYDQDGNLQGWTTVTIGAAASSTNGTTGTNGKGEGGKLPDTGASITVALGIMLMLTAAGVTISMVKRAHR